MTTTELGVLQKVDLHQVWQKEAEDFTPWLAREENLALLADTIGVELEHEATEKDVGPFRADILCKDTATGDWVLIENQLVRTDHTHLGQLMTYAAGLKAVTIVWVADKFTDEHRAALDWLNQITGEKFGFFGLEVELWRIGDSPLAPKFNVVCKPNEWTKPPPSSPELTDTKLLQREYWSALRGLLLERNGVVKPQKASPQHWTNFSVGRSYFGLWAAVNTQKKCVTMGMSCYGPGAKAHFHLLEDDRQEIEQQIEPGLSWEALPNRKESKITLRLDAADPMDRRDWPRQHKWLIEKLEAFHQAFSPRVKQLDASEYRPDEPESSEDEE